MDRAHWSAQTWLGLLLALCLAACASGPQSGHPASMPAPPAKPVPLTMGNARQVAVACAHSAGLNVDAFVTCSRDRIALTPRQQALLDCAMATDASKHFAECAAPKMGITLNKTQIVTANCALQSQGVLTRFAQCAGYASGHKLSPAERGALDCAAQAGYDPAKFAACGATKLHGGQASEEERIALGCAVQSGIDYAAFTTCAGANFFNIHLDADQTIAVQCVIASFGEPHASVGCIATRFLERELRSCTSKGFGGAHGCFGDESFAGRKGLPMRTYAEVTASAGATWQQLNQRWANSGMMERAHQWWIGTDRFVRDPMAFWEEHRGALAASRPKPPAPAAADQPPAPAVSNQPPTAHQ